MNDRSYPSWPTAPAIEPGESGEYYGARLVIWLLASGAPAACLADDQARRAHIGVSAALAITLTIGTTGDRESTPAVVYDRLETLRRELRASLTARARLDEELAPAPATLPAPADGDDPVGGHLVKVRPIAPVYPPAGSMSRPPAPAGKPEIRF